MTEPDDTQTYANTSATSSPANTGLAQSRSPDVLAMTHRDLRVKRNKVGAETPLGWHLSNLDQQLRNWRRETDPTARANLERFMGWSVAAIEKAR